MNGALTRYGCGAEDAEAAVASVRVATRGWPEVVAIELWPASSTLALAAGGHAAVLSLQAADSAPQELRALLADASVIKARARLSNAPAPRKG